MHSETQRPDPDELLERLRREDNRSKTGHLHIFLGMCPGVGKTFAMLQVARQRLVEGLDIVVGIVETHARAETAALLEGLEILPRRALMHRETRLEEFDLDALLVRRPQVVLIDEIAHTNAPGSRHNKRFQDVLEILNAGIDVYTTLNVQHIESQIDTVRQISGINVQETVPDSILDIATEIQLVDLPIEKLLERMADGKIYPTDRADRAIQGFFKEHNLTALRELALRFTADRVDRDLEDIRRQQRSATPWKTNIRLLVAIGPGPHSEGLIRWTRRAATRLGCPWMVVTVEKSGVLSLDAQTQLSKALSLARQLGGEVISLTGENVANSLLQVARERNATQIIVGKSNRSPFDWRKSLADQLVESSEHIEVCVVPHGVSTRDRQATARWTPVDHSLPTAEYAAVMGIIVAIAAVGRVFLPVIGESSVALVFLLAVVVAAMFFRRGPVFVMATVSALTWDYFFIPPYFSFTISKPEDWILFGMFFFVALAMGHLTSRLRLREAAEYRRLRLTNALLSVTQSAALSPNFDKGLADALGTIHDLFDADTALIARSVDRLLLSPPHPASQFQPDERERSVADWCFRNKLCAGRFTETLPTSSATWFPLQTSTATMGVLGVRFGHISHLDFQTRQAIEALGLQLALALEKEEAINPRLV